MEMYKIDSTDKSELGINSVKVLDDGKLYYMRSFKEKILNIDIQSFNYIVFEEDIDNMSFSEFNQYFKNDFFEIVEFFEQYLYLNSDTIYGMENKSDNYILNKTFVKNIITFLMMSLPYTYFKSSLKKFEIDGFHSALDAINENNMIESINQEVADQIQDQYNFNNLIVNLEDNITNKSKKDKLQDMIGVLTLNVEDKVKLLEWYISIIENSGEESLKELCKIYLKNDTLNIL